MTATTRKGHVCKCFPDVDRRKVCAFCGREEGFGNTGTSATSLGAGHLLAHGRVHDLVTLPDDEEEVAVS